MARRRRWSTGVRIRKGALGGWHESEPAHERHDRLRRIAREDGAGEVARRLNFLSNVADRHANPELHNVAREDQRWVSANLEDGDNRRGSKPIRVRGSRRARAHRRRRVRG